MSRTIEHQIGNLDERFENVPYDAAGRIRWSILARNKIEFESFANIYGRYLAENGIELSVNSLNHTGLGGFDHALRNFYPGGIRSLRDSLGNKPDTEVDQVPRVTRDVAGRILWYNSTLSDQKNEQIGISNVQGLFLEKFPEFYELFEKTKDGKIVPEDKEKAKKFIEEKLARYKEFCSIISSTCLIGKSAPYFEGSLRVAIRKSFSLWGIEFRQDKAIRQNDGKYSQEGENYAPVDYFVQNWSISATAINKLLKGVTQTEGTGNNGRRIQLYNVGQVNSLISEFLALPQVDENENIYKDETGKQWAPNAFYAEKFGISYNQLKRREKDSRFIIGRDKKNRRTSLYLLDDLLPYVQNNSELPTPNSGKIFVDTEGQEWAPERYFRDFYGASQSVVKEMKTKCRSQMGRDKTGRQTLLYNSADFDKEMQKFRSLPQVDLNSGEFIDYDGEEWVAASYFVNLQSGLTHRNIPKYFAGVRTIHGRDRIGQRTMLYNKNEGLAAGLAVQNESSQEADEQLRKLLEGGKL